MTRDPRVQSAAALSGFPCPECGGSSRVYCTRGQNTTEGSSTKRYRKCCRCSLNFATVELLVVTD